MAEWRHLYQILHLELSLSSVKVHAVFCSVHHVEKTIDGNLSL